MTDISVLQKILTDVNVKGRDGRSVALSYHCGFVDAKAAISRNEAHIECDPSGIPVGRCYSSYKAGWEDCMLIRLTPTTTK